MIFLQEILPDLYRLELPIPDNPHRTSNSYIIKASTGNLIIDTGLHHPESCKTMRAQLSELDIDLSKTNFFITHLHSDHSALVPELKTPASSVFASASDGFGINLLATDCLYWQRIQDFICNNGFPSAKAPLAISQNPNFLYGPKTKLDFSVVKDRSAISIGDYHFVCIETPGHTWGHLCLYEPDKKILFSGDHIHEDIIPNISMWSETGNPLNIYIHSLTKIAALPVGLVLPGHQSVFTNCKKRINEIIQYHKKRNADILSILTMECMTAYDVASHMSWNISGSFSDFSLPQKMYAIGETISHLKYLEAKHFIQRGMWGAHTVYWR